MTSHEARAHVADGHEWTLEIAGDVRALRRVRELAERIARELHLDPATAFAIKVALNEASANGVVHGCRSSADRVRVRAIADAEALVVDVVDPGGSFEPRIGPADPLAPSGRGTMLLEAISDEVAVDLAPGRTTVRLVKRLRRVDTVRSRTGACAAGLA